ncbi:MAG: hypothetical protein HZB18_04085 [Chloroflexi bacterium]|nr:hypothetical protein [Chloroflexota bacterium]
MKEPISLTSDDPIIASLNFRPYRSMVKRGVFSFSPAKNEPQTKQISTPWGAQLIAKNGDMLVFELDQPNDVWPVDAEIFDASYMMLEPGVCIKRAVTLLVPLTDVTEGDADRMVAVNTLEGVETVRAGDFYLAKGVKGEIWAYPLEKANEIMRPAE